MPINYKDYPTNWKTEIRLAILKRANNCCEICNVQNYSKGFRNKEGHFYTTEFIISELENSGVDMFEDELSNCVQKNGQVKPIKIVLTIAHLDHDISNNEFSNLKALCQKCHLDYDKNYHKENRKNTFMKKKGIIKLIF